MGAARKQVRRVLVRVILFGVVTGGLVRCAPLPRGSVDPLVPLLGLPQGEKGPVQRPSESPTPAEAPRAQ